MRERDGLAAAGMAPGTASPVHPLIRRLFTAWDQTGVPWVLLRGGARLSCESGDVDVLVPARWLAVVVGLTRASGFLDVPSPGHGSHRFFQAYDRDADRWVRIDVVTRFACGRHQELPVLRADALLARRARGRHAWELKGPESLWALLLHYALDGAVPDGAKREELRRAARQGGDDGPLVARVRQRLHDDALVLRASEVAADGDDAALAQVLAALRQRWPRRGALARRVVDGLRQRLSRLLPGRRGPGLTVAVLGPDGAGKSTLIAALQGQLPWSTRAFYVGVLRTTDFARRLRRVPGLMLLVRIVVFRGRYALAMHHRRRGRIVLFDRYTYDALMPVVRCSRRAAVSAAVLLRLCPPPDVTVVLDAPAELMWSRKGELGLEQLEDFRQCYLGLHHRVPRVTTVNASQPAEGVRREVTDLLYRAVLARQTGSP